MNWFTVSKTRSFVSHKQNKPCRYLLSIMFEFFSWKGEKRWKPLHYVNWRTWDPLHNVNCRTWDNTSWRDLIPLTCYFTASMRRTSMNLLCSRRVKTALDRKKKTPHRVGCLTASLAEPWRRGRGQHDTHALSQPRHHTQGMQPGAQET